MTSPFNAVTGNTYSENNTLLLIQAGFEAPEFAAYKQWQSVGRQVRKGEKGTRLVRVVVYHKDTPKERTAIKHFSVFNISQTDAIEGFEGDQYMANCTPEEFTAASMAQLHKLTSSNRQIWTEIK